jgi:hypothetical protein
VRLLFLCCTGRDRDLVSVVLRAAKELQGIALQAIPAARRLAPLQVRRTGDAGSAASPSSPD